MRNDYSTLTNQLTSALNPQQDYANIQLNAQQGTLGLRQLSKFNIVNAFKDSDGKQWRLVKSANDSSVEIPDPSFVQVTDYWNHEFPNSNGKVFIYVVEGIKKPRIETEAPVRVLYQWFSTKNNPQFTPQLISSNEWHRANVYTAPISDSRVSKLSALCGVEYAGVIDQPTQQTEQEPDIDMSILG